MLRRPAVNLEDLATDATLLRGHFELDERRIAGDHSGVRGEGSVTRSLLAGTGLAGASLGPVDCTDTVFDGVDLSNSRWSDVTARRVELTGCRATGWAVSLDRLEDAGFYHCRFDFSVWECRRSAGIVLFENCTFRDASFSGQLDGFVFRNCNFEGIHFDASSAVGSDLRDSRLQGMRGLITLRGAQISADQLTEVGEILAAEIGITIR